MYLEEEECEKYTGNKFEYYLNLTGIHGLYNDFIFKNAIDSSIKWKSKQLTIEIETEILEEYTVVIDKAKKEIVIHYVEAREGISAKGITWKLLLSMVQNATREGYRKITVEAYREKGCNGQFIGYLLWCKFGFYMSDRDHKRFLNFTAKHNLLVDVRDDNKTLDLLTSVESGQEFWRLNGERWNGEFLLYKNSWSRNKLAGAIISKYTEWGEKIDFYR